LGFLSPFKKNDGIINELAQKSSVSFNFTIHCSSVNPLFYAIPWAEIPASRGEVFPVHAINVYRGPEV